MNRTAWLSGVAAAALLAGASAPSVSAAAPIPAAFSYADLLDPVPDAAARLAIDDSAHERDARLQTVQYRREHHHHHHHHHHHQSWQAYPDNGAYWNGGSWAVTPYYAPAQPWYGAPDAYSSGWGWVAPAPYYRDHHHHHHHHHAWRRR
jgi:hypothetical protein